MAKRKKIHVSSSASGQPPARGQPLEEDRKGGTPDVDSLSTTDGDSEVQPRSVDNVSNLQVTSIRITPRRPLKGVSGAVIIRHSRQRGRINPPPTAVYWLYAFLAAYFLLIAGCFGFLAWTTWSYGSAELFKATLLVPVSVALCVLIRLVCRR